MRKTLFLAALCGVSTFFSCNPDIVDKGLTAPEGVVILNEGSFNHNNASLSTYSIKTRSVTSGVFKTVNGKALGETAQSMLQAGDRLYIAVSGSQRVYVTDLSLKITDEIVCRLNEDTLLSPRYMLQQDGRLYITCYEGYLAEYTLSDSKMRFVKVGANPEGLAYAKGKLYVANSGGMNYPQYSNTVSVIDAQSFELQFEITVGVNPVLLYADKIQSRIYLYSFGNYSDLEPKVQAIDTATQQVEDLDFQNPSWMTLSGNTLYVLCAGYDSNWQPLPGTISRYNTHTCQYEDKLESVQVPSAYKISADSDYIFVSSSDYLNTGDVYVFKKDGELLDKFDTYGMNPSQVICK